MARDYVAESSEQAHKALAWAIDLSRAVYDRPLWARLLLRLALGKYAYRELVGIVEACEKWGGVISIGYDLQDMSYHADKVPLDIRQVVKH